MGKAATLLLTVAHSPRRRAEEYGSCANLKTAHPVTCQRMPSCSIAYGVSVAER